MKTERIDLYVYAEVDLESYADALFEARRCNEQA